jgi:DnaJ-class molecular chaperone
MHSKKQNDQNPLELESLGKGLPKHINSKKCIHCSGRGYIQSYIVSPEWIMCPECKGLHRLTELPCRRCNGSGKFIKNGRHIGDCRRCNGTGTYKPKHPVTCHECNPAKPQGAFGKILNVLREKDPQTADYIMTTWLIGCQGYIPDVSKNYEICKKCNGAGEVEVKIFNNSLQQKLMQCL